MAKLQCDICGGQLKMQAGGNDCVCENCGMGYTVDRMRELYSGIKVSVTGTREDVEQWKALLKTYLASFDYDAAEKTVKKILEATPGDEYANKVYGDLQELKHFEIRNGILVEYHGRASVIRIPDGVTAIENNAFKSLRLNGITIDKLIIPGSIKRICALGDLPIKAIELQEGVQIIAFGTFYGNHAMVSVSIPKSVTEVGANAFYECSKLTNVSIPEGVVCISDDTFYGCKCLESVTLPSSLTKIGRSAFAGCSSLTSIGIPAGVVEIGAHAFGGCINLQEIKLPVSLKVISVELFKDCAALKSVFIPSGITEIEGLAFCGCASLESLVIPDTLERIDSVPRSAVDERTERLYYRYTFTGCDALTVVQYPEHIGEESFIGSAWYNTRRDKKRKGMGVCRHCGGKFKGVFTKTCIECGKVKDY